MIVTFTIGDHGWHHYHISVSKTRTAWNSLHVTDPEYLSKLADWYRDYEDYLAKNGRGE